MGMHHCRVPVGAGHPDQGTDQVLTLVGGPVLLHLHLVEAVRERETRGMAERVQPCVTGPGDLLALGRLTVSFLINHRAWHFAEVNVPADPLQSVTNNR